MPRGEKLVGTCRQFAPRLVYDMHRVEGFSSEWIREQTPVGASGTIYFKLRRRPQRIRGLAAINSRKERTF